jgi:hypothetical protein
MNKYTMTEYGLRFIVEVTGPQGNHINTSDFPSRTLADAWVKHRKVLEKGEAKLRPPANVPV